MIVIMIISIVTGTAAVMLTDSSDQRFKNEAKRLQQVLVFATDEASYRNRILGFYSLNNGYEILTFSPNSQEWESSMEKKFAHYQLPETISLEIEVENQHVDSTERGSIGKEDAGKEPQLFILPDGEISPFIITMSSLDKRLATIQSDSLSKVSIEFSYEN